SFCANLAGHLRREFIMVRIPLLIHRYVAFGSRYIDAFAHRIKCHAIGMSRGIPGAYLLAALRVEDHQLGWFTADDKQTMIGLVEDHRGILAHALEWPAVGQFHGRAIEHIDLIMICDIEEHAVAVGLERHSLDVS